MPIHSVLQEFYLFQRLEYAIVAAMSKSRLTSWILIPVILVVSVVGLFFTVTDPSSWPMKALHMSATDMRLAPRVSTIWCESVVLSSEHPFIAYHVTEKPAVNSQKLAKNSIDVTAKLNRGKYNLLELRYYLLPGSVINVFSCASKPSSRLYIFKDRNDIVRCLQIASKRLHSSEYDSEEDSPEEDEFDDGYADHSVTLSDSSDICPLPLKVVDIPVTYFDTQSQGCKTGMKPLSVNISTPDNYIIAVTNNNHRESSDVHLLLNLDRTMYSIQKNDKVTCVCTLATSCEIPLSFASKERALVLMPSEPEAGRTRFTVYSQCRPRVEMFALLSVLSPLILILFITFVIRFDRKRIRKQQNQNISNGNHRIDTAHVTPLLLEEGIGNMGNMSFIEDGRVSDNTNQVHSVDESNQPHESLSGPPAYETLYDPPPPYSSISSEAKSQN